MPSCLLCNEKGKVNIGKYLNLFFGRKNGNLFIEKILQNHAFGQHFNYAINFNCKIWVKPVNNTHLCSMSDSISLSHVFFMGIAGAGMSALAQYLKGSGVEVSGSDRFFAAGEYNPTSNKLAAMGIHCYPQDGSGLNETVTLIVTSTAVEDTVPEVQKAKALGLPFMRRSELLAHITTQKKTIAVGGTSGKSSTAAMLFTILEHAGLQPSLITGAGLVSLIDKGMIGNAVYNNGEWLIIEADESDGSIVQYKPAGGILLNVDKDHKDIPELLQLFETFKQHCSRFFIVNQSNPLAASLSKDLALDYSSDAAVAGTTASNFVQNGFALFFTIDGVPFSMQALGQHTMSNAAAAISASKILGVSLEVCSDALRQYKGIYRRHQLIGIKEGIILIDDYAHNPAKCAASIMAAQPLADKVIAWFQPHGYGPTKFLKDDFIQEISACLRSEDMVCMSEIYYAGGTAQKDISANDLIQGILNRGKRALFVEERAMLTKALKPYLQQGVVLLLMGARDPSLEDFALEVLKEL